MKIKVVPRSDIRITKKTSSKFKPLIEELDKLQPGGDAIRVTYSDEKELNSMRNVVYTYNRETGQKVKSGKDAMNSKIFFYKNK
jgi:hypothetical protein